MSGPRNLEELLQATRKASEKYSATTLVMRTEVPEPGDVLLPERLSAFEVEWAILARHPGDPTRLLVVPADGGSMIGSGDVEITDAAAGGPWTLRCRAGRWRAASDLVPWARTGTLLASDLERACRRWWEIEGPVGTVGTVGTVEAREIDADPEYRGWLEEVVEPARRALEGPASFAVNDVGSSETRGKVPVPRRPRVDLFRRLAAPSLIAAGIAAALLVVFWIQRPPSDEVFVNVGSIGLWPGLRGTPDVQIPPDRDRVTVTLRCPDDPPSPRYRLELRDADSRRIVWKHDGLTVLEDGYLRISLPTSLLPAGSYEMGLFAVVEDRFEPLDVYRFGVSRDGTDDRRDAQE